MNNNERPMSHRTCVTIDLNKPVAYQTLPNENPVIRPLIPRDKCKWTVSYPEYKPIEYTAPIVLANPSWADPSAPQPSIRWNEIDNNIDRRSHLGKYEIINGFPRNPIGRTGITGRGLLGRWGPNHAADPIVTRWKVDSDENIQYDDKNKKPVLQFVAIQRIDTNEWAIPGGMCDPGELISNTMKREFMEEAMNSDEMKGDEYKEYEEKLKDIFQNGKEIYKGYVDDPRNTDNAWMETVAFNFHAKSNVFNQIKLKAGDDAKKVQWLDINSNLVLYASHLDFIHHVANLHNANW